MMPLHWVGNRFLSLVTNCSTPRPVGHGDVLKLFDRRSSKGITIESDRFDFEPEITAKVLRRATASTRSDLLRRP